jgi:hypothetical protein
MEKSNRYIQGIYAKLRDAMRDVRVESALNNKDGIELHGKAAEDLVKQYANNPDKFVDIPHDELLEWNSKFSNLFAELKYLRGRNLTNPFLNCLIMDKWETRLGALHLAGNTEQLRKGISCLVSAAKEANVLSGRFAGILKDWDKAPHDMGIFNRAIGFICAVIPEKTYEMTTTARPKAKAGAKND